MIFKYSAGPIVECFRQLLARSTVMELSGELKEKANTGLRGRRQFPHKFQLDAGTVS